MAKNDEYNRNELASRIVFQMEIDDLREELINRMETEFKYNDEVFQECWEEQSGG